MASSLSCVRSQTENPDITCSRIDTGKLHSLVIEGATVPVTSIIKETFSHTWTKLLENAAASGATASDNPPPVIKRGPKAAVLQSIPGLAPVALVPSEDLAFSDDEGNADETEANINENESSPTVVRDNERQVCLGRNRDVIMTSLPLHSWAPLPDDLWPPKLTIARVIAPPPTKQQS